MKNIDSGTIREILVVSLSNLGDVILTTPVMVALRDAYPKSFISVVIGPKAELLLRGSKTIDKVIVYDKKNLGIRGKIDFVRELRKRPYDLVIDLRNTLIPYLVKTRFRNGLLRSSQISMRDRHLSRLQFLNLPEPKGKFDFFSEQEARSAHEKLMQNGISWERGFLVMAPGAGSYLKRWKVESLREVANHFLSRGKQVVTVGSEEERGLGDKLQSVLPGKPINLCGSLTLRELAAILNDSSLVLCSDSGIMHLANELNAPVVSIFGPTDERKYAKSSAHTKVIRKRLDCTPCELARCRFERQHCMEDIAPAEVIRACEELLSASAD